MKLVGIAAAGVIATVMVGCGSSDPGPVGAQRTDSVNANIRTIQVPVIGVGTINCIIADGSDETGISCDWDHLANGELRK